MGALSIFPLNGNQDTTQESTYKREILSEINDTEEFPEGVSPISSKQIDKYQRKTPSLKAKYELGTYQKCSFCGGINIHINLITCK